MISSSYCRRFIFAAAIGTLAGTFGGFYIYHNIKLGVKVCYWLQISCSSAKFEDLFNDYGVCVYEIAMFCRSLIQYNAIQYNTKTSVGGAGEATGEVGC